MPFESTPLEWVQLPSRHSHILRPRGLIQRTELQLQTLRMVGANARLAALVEKDFRMLCKTRHQTRYRSDDLSLDEISRNTTQFGPEIAFDLPHLEPFTDL